MAQVIWTEPALENLNELAEYIALSNPQAARVLVKNIFTAVDRLEVFPLSGRIQKSSKSSLIGKRSLTPAEFSIKFKMIKFIFYSCCVKKEIYDAI